MAEPGRLGLERRRLAGAGVGHLDLADLIREQVELACAITGVPPERLEGDLDRPHAPGLLAASRERREVLTALEPIEEGRLRGGLEQAEALVLPVDLGEAGAELSQGTHRGDLPADPRPALAVDADRPGQHEVAVLRPLLQVRRRIEAGLHPRGIRAGAHHLGAGLGAEREREPEVTIVLPVPVSPVRTVSPGSSSRSRSSITPRSEIWTSCSTPRC